MPMLHRTPGTCALSPETAMAWSGAPIEDRIMAYGARTKDDHLAIDPKGKVLAAKVAGTARTTRAEQTGAEADGELGEQVVEAEERMSEAHSEGAAGA